jgi:hypothetical protein
MMRAIEVCMTAMFMISSLAYFSGDTQRLKVINTKVAAIGQKVPSEASNITAK